MLLDYHSAYYAAAVVELEAAVEARAGASASLRVERRLSAQVTGAASALATLRVTRPLAASISAQASVSATLHVTRGLSAAVSAQAGASASLTVTRFLAASVAAQAGVVATLRAGVPAPTGTSATLTIATSVASAALGTSEATASLASGVASAALAESLATATLAASAATAEVDVSYVLVEGDTLPVLQATLAVNGTATNLTGASVALRWSMGDLTGEIAGTVTNAAAGVCTFALATVPVGRGTGEIVVTFADDAVRTYPSAAPFAVIVRAHL